ncbi:glycosyltransferase family 2 protein [Rhizomonospora bruguierae]|uniref:glycosyltransferase family 2 protein n=1 Tax=Rhizomonospora bruguierae TaxID=1581705 RepID=UPI001BD00960|nr:glycosyltransferase family 2 protein [Micromonospora sp. NBRC 107566]
MSPESTLVSVVIPHRDRSHLLRLCLHAIAQQTHSPIEVIVVDDGSTDDSVRVATSMGATVVRTATNSGPAAARNLGATHARGRVLLFVDSDIALEPDSVANAVAMLAAEPLLGAVGGILLPQSLVSDTLAARYRALQMYHWWMPTGRPTLELHACVLAVPAEVFTEVGPFNPDLRDTESSDYRFRLTQRYQVRITEAVRGRHDHDSTVRMILRKVFRRARISAAEWRRGETPGDSMARALAGALLLAAVLAIPLPVLVGAAGAVLPLALVAAAIALDGKTYRRVFADRGLAFGLYFVAVHLLVTFTGAAGGAVGTFQRLLSRRSAGTHPQHSLARS